jgi:hypothetical protein
LKHPAAVSINNRIATRFMRDILNENPNCEMGALKSFIMKQASIAGSLCHECVSGPLRRKQKNLNRRDAETQRRKWLPQMKTDKHR